MNDDELNALTEKIIGCAFQVSNTLGSGFLEKVYENALAIELRKNGLEVKQQAPIKVMYRTDRSWGILCGSPCVGFGNR